MDDENDILNLFCEYLRRFGYQPIPFDNPIDALNYIDTDNNISNCSLIITDYKMPQMTGIELLTKIRNKYENNDNFLLKIILISAYMKNDLNLQDIVNNLKIDAIIEKPIRLETLKEKIEKLFNPQQ